jgi:hypothetical protein
VDPAGSIRRAVDEIELLIALPQGPGLMISIARGPELFDGGLEILTAVLLFFFLYHDDPSQNILRM